MKRILVALAVLSLIGFRPARAEDMSTPDSLVWCGLDYSKVKMIGTDDFREPENIFPEMLDKWNALFMKELLPKLEKISKSLLTDIKAVDKPNQKPGPSAVIREDGTKEEMVTPTHITDGDIANAVKNYKIKYQQGTGLVFIIDRLVKVQETGCLYVVFFDIPSRKVVYSERVCNPARGGGFRNYWFRPITTVVEKQLSGMYKKAKSGKD